MSDGVIEIGPADLADLRDRLSRSATALPERWDHELGDPAGLTQLVDGATHVVVLVERDTSGTSRSTVLLAADRMIVIEQRPDGGAELVAAESPRLLLWMADRLGDHPAPPVPVVVPVDGSDLPWLDALAPADAVAALVAAGASEGGAARFVEAWVGRVRQGSVAVHRRPSDEGALATGVAIDWFGAADGTLWAVGVVAPGASVGAADPVTLTTSTAEVLALCAGNLAAVAWPEVGELVVMSG